MYRSFFAPRRAPNRNVQLQRHLKNWRIQSQRHQMKNLGRVRLEETDVPHHRMGCVAICRKMYQYHKRNGTVAQGNDGRGFTKVNNFIKIPEEFLRKYQKVPVPWCKTWYWVLNKTWLNRFTLQTVVRWDTKRHLAVACNTNFSKSSRIEG